jgi:hypothetical protein
MLDTTSQLNSDIYDFDWRVYAGLINVSCIARILPLAKGSSKV